MSKTKISEFSTTPGNNTDINGINIAEGCAPSGINNAIRELMSDLKEWQSGAMDVYVIPQGTAAAPGIQLYGDLDTGLYGYAANQLGVAVGGASAGYFSSAGWVGNVNGTITGDINATTIDTTNLEVTNIKAKDGTAAITIADSTGVVSVSTQLAVDNLNLSGNTLSSSDTNGNIILAPNGTGDVYLDADTIRVGDSNTNVTITSNGTADLILNTNSGTNSGSITIEDGVNGNIIIAPNGTGQVQITNAALDLTTIEVSNINAKDGTAAITIADSTGAVGISTAVTMSATTQNIALGTSQTTGTFTVGGAAQTGTQTFDQSTKTHTLNLGTGATESGLTKTINIGTAGVSGSTTTITIGSANGTTTTLNGTVTAATLNSTTIDTTSIEVTNIKAKDGSASATIADSTGVMTIASSVLTTTDINGGTIDGTTIGGSTAAAGTFTTATATTGNITTVNATTVDTTNLEVTNIKAKDGTAALSIADSTGVVSVSANPVLSGGTANGVLYLNASKVATSGSALTFDGTNLGVGGSVKIPQVYALEGRNAANSGTAAWFGVAGRVDFGVGGDFAVIGSTSGVIFGNSATNTEQMRFTSGGQLNLGGNFTSTNNTLQVTGNAAIGYTTAAPTTGLIVAGNVGVGTDSPGVKLDIAGNATVQNGVLTVGKDTVYDAFINSPESMYFNVDSDANSSGNKFTWGTDRTGNTGGTTWMTLDSSGNLTLATGSVNSSAWYGINSTSIVSSGSGSWPLLLGINSFEKARITSGGYFKASDNGTYAGSSGTFHEFYQTANERGLQVRTTNASYTNKTLEIASDRNTTDNSYYFIGASVTAVAYRFQVADSGSISTAGSIQLGDAGAPPTSGVGVKFPATQSASTDANTLDDYEEGTWTPAIAGSTSAGTATYSVQNARYTKVGRMVFVELEVSWSSGNGTGNLRVTGLPFTSANITTNPALSVSLVDFVAMSANNVLTALVTNNATRIELWQYPTGGGATTEVPYDAAGLFCIAGCYTV